MYEHALGYSFASALELARTLKYDPLPRPDDPAPTATEAIELIRHERRTCGFNWITGEVAESVLQAYVAGRAATAKTISPYPDWSDEHRAWTEGRTDVKGKTQP